MKTLKKLSYHIKQHNLKPSHHTLIHTLIPHVNHPTNLESHMKKANKQLKHLQQKNLNIEKKRISLFTRDRQKYYKDIVKNLNKTTDPFVIYDEIIIKSKQIQH